MPRIVLWLSVQGDMLEERKNALSQEAIVDLQKLMESMLKESERAVVIVAAARLDAELEALLKHLLIPHPGGTDPLFDGDRMLGTFSAKIGMAYRLGAIDNDIEHSLQILRKIRNDFAHQLDTESLSSPRQKQRLAILVRWASTTHVFDGLMKLERTAETTLEHAQFVCCTVILAATLHVGVSLLTRVSVGKALSINRAIKPA